MGELAHTIHSLQSLWASILPRPQSSTPQVRTLGLAGCQGRAESQVGRPQGQVLRGLCLAHSCLVFSCGLASTGSYREPSKYRCLLEALPEGEGDKGRPFSCSFIGTGNLGCPFPQALAWQPGEDLQVGNERGGGPSLVGVPGYTGLHLLKFWHLKGTLGELALIHPHGLC